MMRCVSGEKHKQNRTTANQWKKYEEKLIKIYCIPVQFDVHI